MGKFVAAIMMFALFGCATPRSNSIFPLNFSDQAARSLMKIKCQGDDHFAEGVFACEEKAPTQADVKVKVMPAPGRIIYSNGITKAIDDFNWRETGFWIFKKKRIDTTWIPLDLGELNSIFGEVPIAFNVQATVKDVGVIVNRGVIYHRVCNDRDIPCSKLVVKYDCAGKIKNTWEGQLGYCSRMSDSSQDFEVPLKTPLYDLPAGSRLIMVSGRSTWELVYTVTKEDAERGYVKIEYPNVYAGPDLIGIRVLSKEQDVTVSRQTHVLIVGFSPKWTGIDKPHYYKDWHGTRRRIGRDDDWGWDDDQKNIYRLEWSKPVLSDLMEVVGEKKRKFHVKDKIHMAVPKKGKAICAYAFQRQSGDITWRCLDDKLKEIEHP